MMKDITYTTHECNFVFLIAFYKTVTDISLIKNKLMLMQSDNTGLP